VGLAATVPTQESVVLGIGGMQWREWRGVGAPA